MKKIIKYVIIDILRSRIILVYTLFLLILGLGLFSLEDNTTKGMLGLMNVVLIIVPLVSIIYGTIYIYNSAEFIELLVSQPLQRRTIWMSMLSGLSISLTIAFLAGAGIPVMIYQCSATGIVLLGAGVLLSVIFTAVALLAAVKTRDKAKGIGVAILLWLYFSVLFDGLVLFLLFQFADYPVEKAMVGISMLNPVDLGRILVLLQMDVSALMGFTGAVFRDFFGTVPGIACSVAVLLLWIILPALLSVRQFEKKDL
jgi:Cu-processing system permease protein